MEQDLPERAAVITKVSDHGDEMGKGLFVTGAVLQFENEKY
ncbi:MAG: hypothetical protein AB2604_00545 [Candidatus Thiodiazotropha taylori]|nr:hypothetical protein [Candidatus Thiodiazotropha taylori]